MRSTHAMRLACAFGALALALSCAAPAAAQSASGDDVIVNPDAIGGYGMGYGGRRLLQPGETARGLPPVHLHPPGLEPRTRAHRRRHVARKAPKPAHEAAAPESTTRAAIAQSRPETPPARHAPAQPARKAAPTAIPFSLGGGGGSSGGSTSSAAAPPAPHNKVATAEKLPKVTVQKGLAKQAAVLFDSGSAAISDNTSQRLNELAFSLKTSLASGADRIELVGYGGSPGDTSSAARRLSLKRALAVREALIVDGVPAGRIDVRALGGVPAGDNGATDRVDIFVKG